MRPSPPRRPSASPPRRPSRRALLAAAPLATLGLASCGVPEEMQVDAETVLSIALGQAESHPSYGALVDFGDDLAAATDGRIGSRVYPNESLGAQQEVVQLVSDGAVDMAVISSTTLENLSIRFRPMNLPGVFDDIDHQALALADEAITGEVFTSLEDSANLMVLGGFTQGARHVYTSSGEVMTPEDLTGRKIRVQESDVFLDLIRAMGGSPTPMAYGEVYTALQAGVLDGAENNEISYWTQRHYEIAGFYNLTSHFVGFDYLVINAARLRELGGDEDAFRATVAAMQDSFVETWRAETEATMTRMVEAGVQVAEPDVPEVWSPIYEEVARSFLTTAEDEQLYESIRALAPTEGGA